MPTDQILATEEMVGSGHATKADTLNRALNKLTTAGDLMYATAAQTVARLALGAANLKLFVNAGATAPEWAAGVKAITATRVHNAVAGDVAYTGAGFKPSSGIFLAMKAAGDNYGSIGFAESSIIDVCFWFFGGNSYSGTTKAIYIDTGTGAAASMDLKTWDADGFTGTWTQGGDTDTIQIYALLKR